MQVLTSIFTEQVCNFEYDSSYGKEIRDKWRHHADLANISYTLAFNLKDLASLITMRSQMTPDLFFCIPP